MKVSELRALLDNQNRKSITSPQDYLNIIALILLQLLENQEQADWVWPEEVSPVE